jgi:hypothetical protein
MLLVVSYEDEGDRDRNAEAGSKMQKTRWQAWRVRTASALACIFCAPSKLEKNQIGA